MMLVTLLRMLVALARWLRRPVVLCVAWLVVFPAFALAVTPSPHLLITNSQFWAVIIGSLSPLVSYALNHWAPWVREPVKGIVQVVIPAIATAIYSAVATRSFGWNTATVELVVSGVVSALVAHRLLWLPSGISVLLGGGSDAPPARPKAVAQRR